MNVPSYYECVDQWLDVNASSDNCNTAEVLNVTLENKEKKEELMMVLDLSKEVSEKDCVELEERSVVIEKKVLTYQELKECQDRVCEAIQSYNLSALAKELETITIDQKYELLKIYDNAGCTVWHWSVLFISKEAIELLLEGLSMVQKVESLILGRRDLGWNALHIMVGHKNLDVISLLLEGLNETQRLCFLMASNRDERTVLHLASCVSNPTLVELLLEGLSVENRLKVLKKVDKSGVTPLYESVATDIEVCKVFLEGLSIQQIYELVIIETLYRKENALGRALRKEDRAFLNYLSEKFKESQEPEVKNLLESINKKMQEILLK